MLPIFIRGHLRSVKLRQDKCVNKVVEKFIRHFENMYILLRPWCSERISWCGRLIILIGRKRISLTSGYSARDGSDCLEKETRLRGNEESGRRSFARSIATRYKNGDFEILWKSLWLSEKLCISPRLNSIKVILVKKVFNYFPQVRV